ncbi:hypothetical protein KFE94_11845 [bacterium SCSIO 12643]|nr:hypothetical protein KFE94_11845 [bacterium SCSIO 12643]
MKTNFVWILLSTLIISCSDSIELKDGVYLKKNNPKKFELIFDRETEEKRTYKNVDSLSIAQDYYGFLFFGARPGDAEKKWYYVTGASLEFKKEFGSWYDSEFRKYRINELPNGRQLYENLQPTEQIWNAFN